MRVFAARQPAMRVYPSHNARCATMSPNHVCLLSNRDVSHHLQESPSGDKTRSLEVRSVENRPVVIAVAFLLLFAALAFWRSCSY